MKRISALTLVMGLVTITADSGLHSSYARGLRAPASVSASEFSEIERVEADYPFLAEDQAGLDAAYTRIGLGILKQTAKPKQELPSVLHYDPALATLAAGLESRGYARKDTWVAEALAYPAEADPARKFYASDVTAYFRRGEASSRKVFVLMGSTYSTWKFGSWHAKTIHLLDEIYGRPNIVAFSGFQTKEFLSFKNAFPDVNQKLIAADLYERLRAWLPRELGSGPLSVNLIGYSGGATLVFQLMAEDANHSSNGELFFDRGISFNPILHARTAFENLDHAVDRLVTRGFPEDAALSTPGSIAYLLSHGFQPKIEPVLELSADSTPQARRQDIINRFRNEFVIVDLKTTTHGYHSKDFRWKRGIATPSEVSEGIGNRYMQFYGGYAFALNQKNVPAARGLDFDAYTDFKSSFASVRHPLYILFTEDDAVLSNSQYMENHVFPAEIVKSLGYARANPWIRAFVPKYGSHMGYYLDTAWTERLLRATLGEPTSTYSSQ